MHLSSSSQPLIRRLLGYYLLFGLTSLIALALVLLSLEVYWLHNAEDRELLGRINEVRTLIVADHTQTRGVGSQTLVNLLSSEDWVAYAGVVATDGRFTAHTRPSQIGQRGNYDSVKTLNDSIIERRMLGSDGRSAREYWAPLLVGGKALGCLQVGVVDAAENARHYRLSGLLPLAVLGPSTFLLVGAMVLFRAARTSAVIESQLCAVSASDSPADFRLKPLGEPSPAALGWNRLVEHASGRRSISSLETSLSRSLGGLQEKRSERILNALPDGVAMTDKEGCITYTNRSFGILLQQSIQGSQTGGSSASTAASAEQLRGRPIREMFPADTDLHLGSTEELRPVVFEVQLGKEPADGVLRVSRCPLAGDDNAPAAQQVWTIRDVTQQKLADAMRTEFVYSATHELRTPLANIKAYAETLSMHDITDLEQQKSFLNIINSEATRLGRFVEELLNISQLEAGSLSLVRQEIDLERLLIEVADKVRPQMQQKQITFDTVLPAKLPKIHVDKSRFLSALVNLLGNAAKYTPDNGRISFKVAVGPKDLQISVEDSGIGISAEELPKLFSKFFRSSDARVREIPGSGLGLAFTQEVVRLHGGKLIVHSELNKGSQFIVSLPVA